MSMIDVISDHSNKNLEQIPTRVLEMYNLKMLYLEGNQIQSLPNDFFERLSKLTWLDLRKNELKTIPIGIAYHTCLETLLLQDNNIEELPNEIGVVPNLKVLQVSGNPLKYPVPEIVEEGIESIRDHLKQEFYKLNKEPIVEEEEEQEIAVIDRKSSSQLTKITERVSVQELLRRSAKRNRTYGLCMPIIDVRSLTKGNSEDNAAIKKNISNLYIVRPIPVKKQHKITTSCSKISLKSYSQWATKKRMNAEKFTQEQELRDMWIKRLKDLLADQEKILQQEKNLKALNKWRIKKKMEPPRAALATASEAPYDTDPECDKILSRKDLTKQIEEMIKNNKKTTRKVHTTKKVDLQKLIDEVVDQMKAMESKTTIVTSPRAEQEIATKQIESIVELHKKILALQASNEENL